MTKVVPSEKIQYLDHGYVQLINWLGNDETIAMAARASYNEEEYGDHVRNEGLVRYLVEHRHTSPIEQVSITFRLKIPIFVMRQHVRHRTAKLNEQSLRYVEHDGDFYVPAEDRMHAQSTSNKQGSGELLNDAQRLRAKIVIDGMGKGQYFAYKELLELGMAKELARMVLGTNYYTTVVWQMDLHNLLHYLSLRSNPHAQWEIRELARIIEEAAEYLFPVTVDAWRKYIKNSTRFSESEMEIIRSALASGILDLENTVEEIDGSKRRAKDFINKLKGLE